VDRDEPAGDSGEDRLIARFFRPLVTAPGALGLMDDAATLTPPPDHDLVLTVDALVAGVHFFPHDPPDLIARKALRVNLSDLAAKGAAPAGCLLALALPSDTPEAWLEAFSRGLRADVEEFACPLFGGDTVSTPGPLTISVTAFGTLPRGTAVRRRGARPGDRIVVTGTIGDAALGLALRRGDEAAARWSLNEEQRSLLIGRYLMPRPRLAVAEALRISATAAMDISDGLIGDLAKLCRASGVAATVQAAAVPLSDGARRACDADPAVRTTLLGGGDDYEILATVPPAALSQLQRRGAELGIPFTDIGVIEAGDGPVSVLDRNGKALDLARASFSHF